MASNKDLIKEISALAKELSLDISTDDKNNKDLCDLLSDLKAKKRDHDLITDADKKATEEAEKEATEEAEKKAIEEAEKAEKEATEEAEKKAIEEAEKAEKEATEKAKKSVYRVAKGKAITTKLGMVAEGDPITPDHLHGGLDTIVKFIRSGYIVKK